MDTWSGIVQSAPDRRTFLKGAAGMAVGLFALSGCSWFADSDAEASGSPSPTGGPLAWDPAAWQYDEGNDVYWQIGRTYVTTPAASEYETLGVFVPGAYLSATRNDDATYTATVNSAGKVGGFTAATAPIVFPVNTPGYAAQKPPSQYTYAEVSAYLAAGFVYVAAGMRGRDSNSDSYTGNAPWGVTDLKSAVRYVRYNAASIPGDTDSIFVFGHSGGGAQSSVMGASGDSALYTPYLDQLGAAMQAADGTAISDAVAGVMAWCPITNLDYANAAYEWNMGQFAATGTRQPGTWTAAYSDDLSRAWATYVNKLGLRDSSGTALKLAASDDGIRLAGSYYDHLLAVLGESLTNFLSDTAFPYTPSAAQGGPGGMSGTPPGGSGPSGEAQPGAMPSGAAPSQDATGSGGAAPAGGSDDSASSTTFQTVADYIDSLNADTQWVRYDADSGTATVLSLEGFVRSQKNASKDVGAFDGIDRGATENVVLGLGGDGLHFAGVSHDVIDAHQSDYESLGNWQSGYAASEYARDFAKTDSVGVAVPVRSDMYNPLYFLSPYYDGHKTAGVAPHWRIRTGIMQGDTANTTEINLALALANYGIEAVDFATVWGLGHTQAERTGDATGNFIAWVTQSVAG